MFEKIDGFFCLYFPSWEPVCIGDSKKNESKMFHRSLFIVRVIQKKPPFTHTSFIFIFIFILITFFSLPFIFISSVFLPRFVILPSFSHILTSKKNKNSTQLMGWKIRNLNETIFSFGWDLTIVAVYSIWW